MKSYLQGHSQQQYSSTMKWLCLILFILIQQAQTELQLSPLTIVADKPFVGEFTAITVTTSIVGGRYFQDFDRILIKFPEPASFSLYAGISVLPLTTGIKVFSTSTSTNYIRVTLRANGTSHTTLQLYITNFKCPSSNMTITGITAALLDGGDVFRAKTSQSSNLGILPNDLNGVTLSSSSNFTNQNCQNLTITIANKNVIPAKGSIKVKFPPWNSNFIDINRHYFQTETPKCFNVKGLGSTLKCTYSLSTSILTVTNLGTSDIKAGSTFSFAVSGFKNPYSTRPRYEFDFWTFDTNGYTIDQAFNKSLTTVNQVGKLWNINLVRLDSKTTIGDISQIDVSMKFQNPIAFPCRIQIWYPHAQYFPSNYILKVDTLGLVNQNFSYLITSSTASSGFSGLLVTSNNCGFDLNYPQNTVPTDYYKQKYFMVNKGWLKNSTSFKVIVEELHSDGVYYSVENITSNVFIDNDNIQPGLLTDVKLISNANIATSEIAKFNLQLSSAHYIPNTYQVKVRLGQEICIKQGPCTIKVLNGSLYTYMYDCFVNGDTLTLKQPLSQPYLLPQLNQTFSIDISPGGYGIPNSQSQSVYVQTFAYEIDTAYLIDNSNETFFNETQRNISPVIQPWNLNTISSCTVGQKFCGASDKFQPPVKYELFEGFIALYQSGIIVSRKEPILQSQQRDSCLKYGSQERRILSIKQLGDNQSPVANEDKKWPQNYLNPEIQSTQFLGDTLIFDRCFYHIKFAFDVASNKQTYSLSRYSIQIGYSKTIQDQTTMLTLKDSYNTTINANEINHEDLPCKVPESGLFEYHPGINAIVYFLDDNQTLIVKADQNLNRTSDVCLTNLLDPSHLIGHYSLNLTKLIGDIGFDVTSFPSKPFIFLNESLFVRAIGKNRTFKNLNLVQTLVAKVDIKPLSTTNAQVTVYPLFNVNGTIANITAFDLYGFIYTVDNEKGYYSVRVNNITFNQLHSAPLKSITNGTWRLYQNNQGNHMSRPIYGVNQSTPNVLYRMTPFSQNVFLNDSLYSTNFFDYELQLTRYHGLVVLPGSCSCGLLSGYNQAKGILINLRSKQVARCIDLSSTIGCGDGYLSSFHNEQCDDGNVVSGDGCSSDCQIEDNWSCLPIEGDRSICYYDSNKCGNKKLDTGEQCDDGNRVSSDGCSSTCDIEEAYNCTGTSCQKMCGDGKIYVQDVRLSNGSISKYQETCDQIAGCDNTTCTPLIGWNCSYNNVTMKASCVQTCGNKIKELWEACDDGNSVGGDGCSSTCQTIESGYDCPTPGQPCEKKCGNGIFEGVNDYYHLNGTQNEACDDGNRYNNDGCSSTCQVEVGYYCNLKYWKLIGETPVYKSICYRNYSIELPPPIVVNVSDSIPQYAFYKLAQTEEFGKFGYTAQYNSAGRFKIIELEHNGVSLKGVSYISKIDSSFTPYEVTVVEQLQNSKITQFQETKVLYDGSSVRNTFGPFFFSTLYSTWIMFNSFVTQSNNDIMFQQVSTQYLTQPDYVWGAPEFYYWPKLKMILYKLSDGYTWKSFKFNPKVTSSQSLSAKSEWIKPGFVSRVVLKGSLRLEPIFFEDYIIVYQWITGKTYPTLQIYKQFSDIEEFLPISEEVTFSVTSQNYLTYSFVLFNRDFGILFKESQSSQLWRLTVPYMNKTNPTLKTNGHIIDISQLVFLQRRHDPLSQTEETRDVYGYFDNKAIYKFEANGTDNSISIVQKIDLPQIGVFLTESRMIDIGKYHLAVYSAADCQAVVNVSEIKNPSIWYYKFATQQWSCMDIPYYVEIHNERQAWPIPREVTQ